MAGRLVVMGSGEIAPSMVATHRRALRDGGADRVTILDTPFGFQENADELTDRIAAYFRTSLSVRTEVASLRSTAATPADREVFLRAIRRSPYVFAGPGSPTYALRVWRKTGLAGVLRAKLADSGTVVLASAAALTAGSKTIPVYEIYKVGSDPFWADGLDLTGHLGLPLVVVPHWNNAEGGTHDTSHCFIGRRRFDRLAEDLEVGVLGVDEHTAASLDFAAGTLTASGAGEVTMTGDTTRVLESGETVGLDVAAHILGGPPSITMPVDTRDDRGFDAAMDAGDVHAALAAALSLEESAAGGEDGTRSELRRVVTELALAAETGLGDPRERVAPFVSVLLDLRQRARSEGRWAEADAVREGLEAAGVEVRDTPDGPEWELR